jgi:hypothetical protein
MLVLKKRHADNILFGRLMKTTTWMILKNHRRLDGDIADWINGLRI